MKIWISLFAVLCFTNFARAQAPPEYPDVPMDNPAYADITILSGPDSTFFCSFGEPVPNQRLMTRYEFAVAIARIYAFTSDLSVKANPNKSEYENSIRNKLSKWNSLQLAALVRLFAEFKPELQQLGITNEQIQFTQKELAARTGSTPSPKPPIAAPFRDVPKTHWAFEAVERLRQSGIVIGTADGAFAK